MGNILPPPHLTTTPTGHQCNRSEVQEKDLEDTDSSEEEYLGKFQVYLELKTRSLEAFDASGIHSYSKPLIQLIQINTKVNVKTLFISVFITQYNMSYFQQQIIK